MLCDVLKACVAETKAAWRSQEKARRAAQGVETERHIRHALGEIRPVKHEGTGHWETLRSFFLNYVTRLKIR